MDERRILLVDDDAQLAELLQDLLRENGYQVQWARDCRQARELCQCWQPQLLLLDLRLPDGDGVILMRQLRKLQLELLFIVLTAYADVDSAAEAVRQGAFRYLRKPVQSQDLLAILQAAFQQVEQRAERQRNENLLLLRSRELEQQYLALADAAREGLVLLQDFKVIYVNRALANMFGYQPEEVLGMDYRRFLRPQEQQESANRITRLLAGQTDSLTTEKLVPDRNGRLHLLKVTEVAVRHEGQPAVLVVTHDDTERHRVMESLRQAKETAERASRLKSEFLSNISHELRTPLSGIIGLTELLREDSRLDRETADHIDAIGRSARSLVEIFDGLLHLARARAESLDLRSEEFSTRQLVAEVVDLMSARAHLKGLALECRVDDEVPNTIVGDRIRLRQVLVNLADNALKFTSAGRVCLQLEQASNSEQKKLLRFSVSDTGPGISPECQQSIFEPLVRKDGLPLRRPQGAGTGLALCRQLVESMGGQLQLTSTPGQGSRFWFEVPLSRPQESAPQPAQPPPAEAAHPAGPEREQFSDLSVLVVDDDSVSREVTTTILKRLGCRVDSVSDGNLAVPRALSGQYDIVLMDCRMPGMDGLQASREIRRLEAGSGRHVQIVAITAHCLDEDRQQCLRAGMDDHLSKPAGLRNFQQILLRARQRLSQPGAFQREKE